MRAPFGAFRMSGIGSNTDNRSWLYGKVRDLPWLTFEGRWLSANQIFPGACFFKTPISVIYRFFHVHHCCNKHWILVIHHVHCPTFWDILPLKYFYTMSFCLYFPFPFLSFGYLLGLLRQNPMGSCQTCTQVLGLQVCTTTSGCYICCSRFITKCSRV